MRTNNLSDRSGFTLTEVLIAIGILAIGMTMVAAIFPAALKMTEDSTNNSLGVIIAENGLAMAKARLQADQDLNGTADAIPGEVFSNVFLNTDNYHCIDESHDAFVTKNDQHYPNADPDTKKGWAMLARRIYTDDTDRPQDQGYMLVVTSYRKKEPSNTARWSQVTVTSVGHNGDDPSIAVFSDGDEIRVGSPLVFADPTNTWQVATIVSKNGANAVLDRQIETIASGTHTAFVLEETGVSGNSPAMHTLVVRTGLGQ